MGHKPEQVFVPHRDLPAKVWLKDHKFGWKWHEDLQMHILEAPPGWQVRTRPYQAEDLGWAGSISIHDHPDDIIVEVRETPS